MLSKNSNQKLFDQFDKEGEAAVQSRLDQHPDIDPHKDLARREWLYSRRLKREETQRKNDLKYIRWSVLASFVLAVATLALAAITSMGVYWQKEDNLQQRENAKLLLGIQISVEFDKQFDSAEMRQARRRVALQLLNNKKVTEFRLLDFFDKFAMYTRRNVIDQGDAEQLYSYWILRYWPAMKPTVENFRTLENDPGFYSNVEDLHDDLLARAAKSGISISNEEVLRFLKEEASLPK